MGLKFELFGNLKKKSGVSTSGGQGFHASSDSGLDSMQDNISSLPPQMSYSDNSLPSIAPIQQMSSFQPASSPSLNIMADISKFASKGMPESEMVQALKNKGYNFKEIDNALGQAIKSRVSGDNLSNIIPGMVAEQPQSLDATFQDVSSDFSQQMQNQTDVTRTDNLEAMIESIVEERLASFKILIDNINASIVDIRGEIDNLDTSLKSVETRTESRVSDIKKEMDILRDDFSEVSPKVSSIERAFKDVVPNLVDAISQVNDKLHIHSEKINTDSIELGMSGGIDSDDVSDVEKNIGSAPEPKIDKTVNVNSIEKDSF
ncbi:MAG: hypothetical protein K0B07_05445 [DPANN group archaeon]|nr:hypothetical protein [DPANN group archaeon]